MAAGIPRSTHSLMSKRAQPGRACKQQRLAGSDSGLSSGQVGDSSSCLSGQVVEGNSFIPGTHRHCDYYSGGVSSEISSVHSESTFSSSSSGSSKSDSTLKELMEEEGNSEFPLGEELVSERQPGRVENGDFHQMFNMFLTQMSHCMEKVSAVVPSSGGDVMSADKNRLIEKLAPYTAGTDISVYIKKLEDDLLDIGVSRSRFKSVLARKLQSGRALSVLSSIDRSECSYEELKKKLIDGLGSDLTTLGIKLISEF